MSTEALTKRLDKTHSRVDGGALDLGLTADSKAIAAVLDLEYKKSFEHSAISGYAQAFARHTYGLSRPDFGASLGVRYTW